MSNRAERRAAKYRKPRRVRTLSNDALNLLNLCSPYKEGVTTVEHIKALDSFGRLKDGSASEDDFLRVAKTLNLAMARACEIDEKLALMLHAPHDAMNRLRERYLSTKKWGFDGPGMQAVADGLGIAQTIMDSSSHKQMMNADETISRVLNKIERNKTRGRPRD